MVKNLIILYVLINYEIIEGNFDNSEVNELLLNHFKELRSVSPEGSVLDIPGLKDPSIKVMGLNS